MILVFTDGKMQKSRRNFLLTLGRVPITRITLLAVNMIQHFLRNEEHFKQLEELKLPRISVSNIQKAIIIRYGRKRTITHIIGSWSEKNYAQLKVELYICLKNPIIKNGEPGIVS